MTGRALQWQGLVRDMEGRRAGKLLIFGGWGVSVGWREKASLCVGISSVTPAGKVRAGG